MTDFSYIPVTGINKTKIYLIQSGTNASSVAKNIINTINHLGDFNKVSLDDNASPTIPARPAVGYITKLGIYDIGSGYTYLVVGEKDQDANNTGYNNRVIINSKMKAGDSIEIVSGRNAGLNYNANGENGTIYFTGGYKTENGDDAGKSIFKGTNQTGNWTIFSGDQNGIFYTTNGNNTLSIGNGDNLIITGTGNNKITLGTGKNNITSNGHDTIKSAGVGQAIKLSGGSSTINFGEESNVNSNSANNIITVGNKSTVTGGEQDKIYSAKDDDNITLIKGKSQTVNIKKELTFLNGTGDSQINVGHATLFGANNLNMNLNANKADKETLYVASSGNETLDGSKSSVALHIFANNDTKGNGKITVTGGNGNDTIVGGSGVATFTGNKGNNLFGFIKGSSTGQTTITDFSASAGNKIGLYNYGLNSDSMKKVLDAATYANGDTTLMVDTTKIVLQHVDVKSLNVAQFEYS